MRTLLITICLLALAFTAHAADVALTWDANTESDLAGYRVYQGPAAIRPRLPGVQQVAATTATIKGLDNTSHSFAVTAVVTTRRQLSTQSASASAK